VKIPTIEELKLAISSLPDPLSFDDMLDVCISLGRECCLGSKYDGHEFFGSAYNLGPKGANKPANPYIAKMHGNFVGYLLDSWIMTTYFLHKEINQGNDPFCASANTDDLHDRFRDYVEDFFANNPEDRRLIEDKKEIKRLIAESFGRSYFIDINALKE
jgi:hypothetical protein